MRYFIAGLLFFSIYVLFVRWYFICEVRQSCTPEEQPIDLRSKTLALTSQDTIYLKDFDEFKFLVGQATPLMNDNNYAFLDSVAACIGSLPSSNYLHITGFFARTEKEKSSNFYENIGIARAAYLEVLLEERGLPASQITLDYKEIDEDSVSQPISFKVEKEASGNKLQYSFEDMTYSDANFEYNSAVFNPGEAFIKYADSLLFYFEDFPDYSLSITGHTDSIATPKYNYDLGLQRAAAARDYFIDRGLKVDIQTISKGETQPVASNTNEDGTDNVSGRAKNRRVNFKIEKNIQ